MKEIVKGRDALHLKQQKVSEKLIWKAFIWEYESLCSFQEPPNKPRTMKALTGGQVMGDGMSCKNMISKYGHPVAVVLNVRNADDVTAEMRIGALSAVTVHTRKRVMW